MKTKNWNPAAMGARLREAREAAGVTQEFVAQAVGVRAHSVYRWEKGKSAPGARKLVKVCEVLGVTSAYVLGV